MLVYSCTSGFQSQSRSLSLEEGSESYLSDVVHYSTLTKQVEGEERGRGLGKRNCCD